MTLSDAAMPMHAVRRHLCGAFIALLICAAPSAVRAQDTLSTANLKPTLEGHVAQLALRDGTSLVGRVLEVTATSIRFASSVGEITVPRSSVASARDVDAASMHDGEIWLEDPSRTRLFFAPTGRMLRTGERYFADAYVFFPSIQYGLSDIVTVGGGMSIFPGIGLDEQLFYLTPKVSVLAGPTVNVAVGALVAGAKGISDDSPFGLGYGVATYGGEDGSITAGGGFGFSRGNTSSTALLMVGGSQRVAKSLALVTENYFTSDKDAGFLLSGGIRFMSEHLAVDLALFGTKSSDTVVPYLAFIYRW